MALRLPAAPTASIDPPANRNQKIPCPTPVKARDDPLEAGVRLPEPSAVVDADPLSLPGETVAVGHRSVVGVVDSFVSSRTPSRVARRTPLATEVVEVVEPLELVVVVLAAMVEVVVDDEGSEVVVVAPDGCVVEVVVELGWFEPVGGRVVVLA